MQTYQIPQDDTSIDFQYWMDYVADMTRYPAHHDDAAHTDDAPLAFELKPCRNADCPHTSYAIYCSEACRVALEGLEGTEDDYYHDPDSSTTLGLKSLADTQWQHDQAAGGFAAMVCGVEPQPAAPVAPPTFTEAPVSISLKGMHHGVDTLITIRGTDLQSVQAQLSVAAGWFDAPATVPSQSPPVETGEGYCRIHNTAMHDNEKEGRHWYSHRTSDGSWCKGKGKGPR